MLKVYDTLSREKKEFKSIEKDKIKMYICGPTVYAHQHIGNLRAAVIGDLVRFSLEYLGYEVTYVTNYTDFGHLTSDNDYGEDKMEKARRRENLEVKEIADKYIKFYEEDCALLNLERPSIITRATDYLNEMIKMVRELLDKGFAYSTPKAIYFDITKFDKYNELNRQNIEMNIAGAGKGEVIDSDKKHQQDFALWFFRTGQHKNAIQYWPSPFSSIEVENGYGFPGWHIECSAMIRKELGKTIDIHMGGIEHIATHHTNEIAQSECANNAKLANYWLHYEHLLLNSKKMSKSLGNILLLPDIIDKGYDAIYFKYFLLQAHYRSKQNFTFDALESSKKALDKLVNNLVEYKKNSKNSTEILEEYNKEFIEAISDDFNIPKALSIVWDVVKSQENPELKYNTIMKFDSVLRLNLQSLVNKKENEKEEFTDEVKDLINERNIAREEKRWEDADKIREELKNKYNITIID